MKRRILVISPFAPVCDGRHGSIRAVHGLLSALADRHELVVLHAELGAEVDPGLAARAQRITHAAAVRALLAGGAEIPSAVRELPTAHAGALGLCEVQAMLGFHGCWIRHADDELGRGRNHGPFIDVVRAVVEDRILWP